MRGQMCVEVTARRTKGEYGDHLGLLGEKIGGEFLICHEGGEGIYDQEPPAERGQYRTS